MRALLFLSAVIITTAAAGLHLIGYFWYQPPEAIYYLVLLFNYAPKWVWLAPAIIAVLLSWQRRRWWKGVSLLLFAIILWVQDVQVRGFVSSHPESAKPLSVMTLNTGGASNEQIAKLVTKHSPDVLLLQESHERELKEVVDSAWRTQCSGSLCIGSRFEFKTLDAYSRATFSDWGSFAVAYELSVGNRTLRIVNAHLETPRDAIGGRALIDYSKQETDEYGYEKNTELAILAALLDIGSPALVAGDLNTSVFEATYRRHLGCFRNAIDSVGLGFNYTKYTRWHGVRIDHIISNSFLTVSHASVLDDVGGDHRPVLVTLAFDDIATD